MSTQETVARAIYECDAEGNDDPWPFEDQQPPYLSLAAAAIAGYESDPPEWLRLILREMVGRSALVHLLSAVPEPALNAAGVTRHPVERSS
jgi:hypothetical protein